MSRRPSRTNVADSLTRTEHHFVCMRKQSQEIVAHHCKQEKQFTEATSSHRGILRLLIGTGTISLYDNKTGQISTQFPVAHLLHSLFNKYYFSQCLLLLALARPYCPQIWIHVALMCYFFRQSDHLNLVSVFPPLAHFTAPCPRLSGRCVTAQVLTGVSLVPRPKSHDNGLQ